MKKSTEVRGKYSHLKLLLKRLLIVWLVYTICRVLFLLFNSSYFPNADWGAFRGGIQFDLTALLLINLPFIVLHMLPITLRDYRGYQGFLKLLFYVTNLPAIALNLLDIEYFKFTLKRSTFDLISLASYGDDIAQLIPVFLRDYWYLIAILVLLIIFIEWLYRKTQKTILSGLFGWKYVGFHTLLMVFSVASFVLIWRGGFQYKPMSIIDAAKYSSPENAPLALNTPFTMILSYDQSTLEDYTFFTPEKLDQAYSPVHQFRNTTASNQDSLPNVVLIVMESFSREYVGGYNQGKGYTPFLDSLMEHSLVFRNAYSNGNKSIEGIPAITASMPTLMNHSFISSPYSTNQFSSLPSLLAPLGYRSSFFHGASNGSMRFDGYTQTAKFDRYMGRNEYNNDAHFDGQWGIWDEEFFQFFAQELNEEATPFFSTFFSLSSHHPFAVPERYEGVFEAGDLPVYKTVGYSDYALRRFFEVAKQSAWYDNTLFIITADHIGPYSKKSGRTALNRLEIPLLFFKGDNSLRGEADQVAQQIDILPTVLDYINYPDPFVSFGESLLRPQREKCAFSYLNNVYQLISPDYVLQFDGTENVAFYHHSTDIGLKRDLLDESNALSMKHQAALSRLERKMKAYVQAYNSRMINNQLTLKR